MSYLRSRRRRYWRRQVIRAVTDKFLKLPDPADHLSTRPAAEIAVIRPNHRLGNMLLLTPLLQEVERLWPAASIDIFGGGRMQAIFARFPRVRKTIATPQPALKILVNREFQQQTDAEYDVIINAEPESHSARFIASRLRSPALVAPQRSQDQDNESLISHMALGPVCALRKLASEEPSAPFPEMSLRLSHKEVEQGSLLLEGLFNTLRPSAVIGLYPFGDKKRDYPNDWWLSLVEAIRKKLPQAGLVEVLPAHGEKRLNGIDARLDSHDLRTLCAQFGAMDLVVATDSGMMHLAACSGTPTFGLFKVTNPDFYAPYGGLNRHWNWSDAAPAEVANAVASVLA